MVACNKMVDKGSFAYPCTVKVAPGLLEHPGPCAALENEPSMRMRAEYERDPEAFDRRQRERKAALEVLRQTQSEPETFAQQNRGAHVASPVPGSDLQPQAYRERYQPRVGDYGFHGDDEAPPCPHPYQAIAKVAATGQDYCTMCHTYLGQEAPLVPPQTVAAAMTEHPADRPSFVSEEQRMVSLAEQAWSWLVQFPPPSVTPMEVDKTMEELVTWLRAKV